MMKRHSFALHLLMLIALGASMNACIIASYQIVSQEANEGRTNLASKDDGSVYVVIPQYHNVNDCFNGSWWPLVRTCRDSGSIELEAGVYGALYEESVGKQVEFTEHIPFHGLVCVVSVNEKPVTDATLYKELFSALIAGLSPIYATREYVLSYTFLLDFKTAKEYQFTIRRKAILGILSWVLVPVVYPFWGDEIGIMHNGGSAKVVKGITKTVLRDARREGIF